MENIVMLKREDLDFLLNEAAKARTAANSTVKKSVWDNYFTKAQTCKVLGISASGFDTRRKKDPNYIKPYQDKGSRILWFKKSDVEALRG